MLKLKAISDCCPIRVEFDPYISVKIVFDQKIYWIDPIAYWRTGDLKNDLLEVGINIKNNNIQKLTVVGIKKIMLQSKKLNNIEIQPGIPIFDPIDYDNNLIFDEKGPLEMFIGKDKLQVLFSHNEITFGLVCDRIICLFDAEKNFCGFEVTNISDEEMKILKENFIDRLQ